MSHIHAWISDKKLTIKIDFHIPSFDIYSAFVAQPIPKPKGYGTFSALLLNNNILLLDRTKTIYTSLPV